ncbi:MAG: anaerobic ribonucleoside-triphosphate reductase [Negativicutes bacterium]|nr:anaerobic ribonucleoside-triphosphate reductase [Negativicutes bacterium]
MLIKGVSVIADQALPEEEVLAIVDEEIRLWHDRNKTLSTIELTLDGDNVMIAASEKSPIRRVRRITGYLSDLENFNQAKQSECVSRGTHT